MKISLSWLKQLVDYQLSVDDLAEKLSFTSIGVKQATNDFLELDLTYNRGDLLSMRGVVREVASITDSKVKFEDNDQLKFSVPESPVKVEDPKLCPVYCVAKIENLKVEHSSDSWVKKLSTCGIRTVNNIADVTNLIMLEYGQPMHAFDADKVIDQTLVVRLASQGETLQTLDGKERRLDKSDLLITDSKKALGIAGVMGGKDSEVSDSTTTILLEAAIFNPNSNRKSSKRHGLYSEATKRFQHGLTRTDLLQALSAAIKMYEGLGGELTAISLTGDLEDKPKTVQLTQDKINSLLGVDIPAKQVESSLRQLGFSLGGVSGPPPRWEVTVPYWRLDINIEEDLIEEVARMYGYEKIEGKPLDGEKPEKLDQSLYDLIQKLKEALKEAGLTEVQTYSFYSSKTINDLRLTINDLVKVANPISSETEYLREFIWPNLVEVVAKNIKNGFKDIAIFEVGKVYMPGPKESYRLTIALMNDSDNPLEELLALQGETLRACKVKTGGMIKKFEALFHPTRFANIEADGKVIGSLAEVHPRFLNNFGIDQRVAILEIDLESLV